MSSQLKRTMRGFTLIEMLLVLAIISMIIYLSVGYLQQRSAQLRINRISAQIQQALNAALAYYVGNGTWPSQLSTLQDGNYLPPATSAALINPWGQTYSGGPSSGSGKNIPASFYVWTEIPGSTAYGTAMSIIGTLPFGYAVDSGAAGSPPSGSACTTASTGCYVVAAVNIPGQNLNNASAVTFAGVYHHGGCVPVPQCPVDSSGNTMTPQIFVAPVSVSGINDPGSTNVYPISSFTAYAKGNYALGGVGGPIDTKPPYCSNSNDIYPQQDCSKTVVASPASAYWRVCLDIVTEKGNVAQSQSSSAGIDDWGRFVTLMAITRCAIQNEPAGSGFKVFSN